MPLIRNRCGAYLNEINYICSMLLDVSRQNIEKIRGVGKFDEIRKLECLVLEYTKKFDKIELTAETMKVTAKEIETGYADYRANLHEKIERRKKNSKH